MSTYQKFKPVQVGVDSTVSFTGNFIGGFIAKTAGTITVTSIKGTVIVDAFPVTVGNILPLPLLLPDGEQGGTITTAGGASGIFCV